MSRQSSGSGPDPCERQIGNLPYVGLILEPNFAIIDCCIRFLFVVEFHGVSRFTTFQVYSSFVKLMRSFTEADK